MRLTVYTDYSLRVLMYVAMRPDPAGDGRRDRRELRDLAQSRHEGGLRAGGGGLHRHVRGQNGGMRLAKRSQDIGLGEVVRRTEPDMALVPCFEPLDAPCVISPACKLKRALQRARDAFLSVLDEYTVADLTENQEVLNALLANDAAPVVAAKAGAPPRRASVRLA